MRRKATTHLRSHSFRVFSNTYIDEEDALLEEEAGKEVQMARLEDMEEGDFMLGDPDDMKAEKNAVKLRAKRKEKNVSRKDKLKFMKKAHPELMPVVDHFKGGLEDFVNTTAVVGDALFGADGGNESEVRSHSYMSSLHC